MDDPNYKLEIFIPEEFVDRLLDVLAEVGAGEIGRYDHCSSLMVVRGTWRALPGADPYDGEVGIQKSAEEVKVEVNCRAEVVRPALKAVRAVHPYEEPVINIVPLANHLFE
jgi:hypothetical protein